MFWFSIKKTFFDMWDHLLGIGLANLGFILLVGIALYALQLLAKVPAVIAFAGMGIVLVLICWYVAAVSRMMRHIADFETPEFSTFFHYLKSVWPETLLFSGIVIVQACILFLLIPWYFSRNTFWGIAIAGLLFWGSIIWLLSSQYFFPFSTRHTTSIRAIPQKCALIFFDNTGFTLLLGVGTVVLLVLSSFTAFLLPGLGTILLWHHVGLKLRLYKYDYLEAHPQANRKQIPWNDLLAEDRQRIGIRTLRGMIFPGKASTAFQK